MTKGRYVATRRRFDSEQAVWATDWLMKNSNIGALKEGWTYLFEIVYQNNRVVIGYPYEG